MGGPLFYKQKFIVIFDILKNDSFQAAAFISNLFNDRAEGLRSSLRFTGNTFILIKMITNWILYHLLIF